MKKNLVFMLASALMACAALARADYATHSIPFAKGKSSPSVSGKGGGHG